MGETIYIVGGTTGEYSGKTDWAVCAYHSFEKAEEHARKAMLRAKELELGGYNRPTSEARHKGVNEFDPKMEMDYTGTEYFTFAVDLHD